MIYIGIWRDTVIGITDNYKDLLFYIKDIRRLGKNEYSIQAVNRDHMDFYSAEIVEGGLWFSMYDGVPIPQAMAEIISKDIHDWKNNTGVLLSLMVNFTKLMSNGDALKEDDIENLIESIRIISDVNNKSEKIFNKLEETSFLTHPVLTCGYDDYIHYMRVYAADKRAQSAFRERISLDYT